MPLAEVDSDSGVGAVWVGIMQQYSHGVRHVCTSATGQLGHDFSLDKVTRLHLHMAHEVADLWPTNKKQMKGNTCIVLRVYGIYEYTFSSNKKKQYTNNIREPTNSSK